MSDVHDNQPWSHEKTKPPRRNWRAAEPFFDLKASHWVEIFLTVALLAVGGTQAFIYWRQAGIMSTQAEIAVNQTKIMQAEHRPWISANPVEVVGVVEHTANGLQFSIGLYLKNTGHSPAKRTSILIQASMKMFKADAQRMICEKRQPALESVQPPYFSRR